MLDNRTIDQLKELKLTELISIVETQNLSEGLDSMPFNDRFSLIVSAFYEIKKTNKIKHLLKCAKLRFNCTLSDIRYPEERKIDRKQIEALGTCLFMRSFTNIIFYGPTGCGKTYLACAIGNAACRLTKKVMYIKHDELIAAFLVSNVAGHIKLIEKYASYDLLIIDEWLQEEQTDEIVNFMFKIIEKRDGKGSTIFCTQYHPSNWYERMKGCPQTEALIDRVFNASAQTKIDCGTYNMRVHIGTFGA